MLLHLTALAFAAPSPVLRPSVLKSAAPDDIVHYFGVGSNMLRSKLTQRGINGTAIEVVTMRPAVVKGHRLAFNMRGFPPLEPGMGALEPAEDGACHGALCEMTRSEYEKVWASEGGAQPNPGYEEVVVEALPYGADSAVPAIALRAREHARLAFDAPPSARYMRMLVDGATELGLSPAYVSELEAVRVARVGPVTRCLAVHHFFLASLLFRHKMAWAVRGLSKALWLVYAPASSNKALRLLSAVATAALLAPTALIGALVRALDAARGRPIPPMLAAIMERPAARAATRVGAGAP